MRWRQWLFTCLIAILLPTPLPAQNLPAFPGAEGFGAIATGGRGGSVYYVTRLDADPAGVLPGSLNHALRQNGPRTILFKVSGVIHGIANIVHGDVTLAGQTSPAGITVRGLICDGHYEQNDCDNLIVRHLALRPAWNLSLPPGGERLDDGLRLDGVHRFIIDHVSIANAVDEAIQVSWASDGTIQNSILGETVGDHAQYGGMLLNYAHPDFPQNRLSIHHNLWYRIAGRLPEISCEASNFDGLPGLVGQCQAEALQMEVSNNLVFDPAFPLYYNRDVDQNPALGAYLVNLNMIGNSWLVRPSHPYGMAVVDLLAVSANALFVDDNQMSLYPSFADYALFYCCSDFPQSAPNTDLGNATRRTSRHPFPSISYDASSALMAALLSQVGRKPRDPMDRRFATAVESNLFSALDHSVPDAADAFALDFDAGNPPTAPVDTDDDGMPDSFEQQYIALGLSPTVFDANGGQLSIPVTGVAGYSNLESYINSIAGGTAALPALFANGFE